MKAMPVSLTSPPLSRPHAGEGSVVSRYATLKGLP
jgi:hypothetical protein